MYICSTPFQLTSSITCAGTLSKVSTIQNGNNFVTCDIPFSLNAISELQCSGLLSTHKTKSSPTITDYTFDADSVFQAYSGVINNPVNLSTDSISNLQTSVTSTTQDTFSVLETLTPADYYELSTFITTILLLAFGLRLLRSLFVTSR